MINADDLSLVLTSEACPEQYDVYHNKVLIGYMRLRHGCFYAEAWKPFQERDTRTTVYVAYLDSDGIFASYERGKYLSEAKEKIRDFLNDAP